MTFFSFWSRWVLNVMNYMMNIQSNEVYTVHLSAPVHGNAEHTRWIKTRMCPTKCSEKLCSGLRGRPKPIFNRWDGEAVRMQRKLKNLFTCPIPQSAYEEILGAQLAYARFLPSYPLHSPRGFPSDHFWSILNTGLPILSRSAQNLSR